MTRNTVSRKAVALATPKGSRNFGKALPPENLQVSNMVLTRGEGSPELSRSLSVVFIIVPGQSSIESMNHATLTRRSLCSDFECSHGTNLQFIRQGQRQVRQAQ
jgi:hypothetical protein